MAEKPHPIPTRMREIFLHSIYPFQAISSNFGFCGRKAPSLPGWGKFFLHWIYPFQGISSNFGFCGRKAPSPSGWGKSFYTGSIHFRKFPGTLVFVAENLSPPPPQDEGNYFSLDLSISGYFQQLWFLWQKSPPPGWGKFFLHRIYPFQAISSNFGFCGRKAPPP